MEDIKSFSGEHRFLSNFWPSEFNLYDVRWPCAENCYQWMKFDKDPELLDQFLQASPGRSKRLSRELEKDIRKDWLNVRVDVMTKIQYEKYTQNPHLAHMLVETGSVSIVEGNTWNDTFWGVNLSTGKGKNMLGKILMDLRNELLGMGY